MKTDLRADQGNVPGLAIEEVVCQLVELFMPLIDRSNHMLLRNLKALPTLRDDPVPSLNIVSAGQVHVASQQVNAGHGKD